MNLDTSVSFVASSAALHQISDRPSPKATTEEKARTQAREFEQVYLSTMMKQMFSGVSTEAPFGGGQAEESWRGLLVDQYAATMQKAGGIGISDMVYRDLIGLQEGASK